MNNKPPPIVSDLVLVGGGHAHVHVLKMLGMPKYSEWRLLNGIRVTLIAKDVHTPYSGMLPGYVAGHYSSEEIHLDLSKLCRFSQVRLIHSAVNRIDYTDATKSGLIYCDDGRPPVRFDCLSINIGSAPAQHDLVHQESDATSRNDSIVPVKPIANFCQFYEKLMRGWQQADIGSITEPYTLAVVGGGAGGLELALATQFRLKSVHPKRPLKVLIVTRGELLLQGHNSRVQSTFQEILEEREIDVQFGATVTAVVTLEGSKKRLVVSGKDDIEVDDILWCVTAGVAPWLKSATPLATTDEGFVRIQPTYESTSHSGIFAAGDCCHNDKHPRPKAGVFAVRAGPYLLENLVRFLSQRPLVPHFPQQEFLGLLSTGDKFAVASKSWWMCLSGPFVWHWKDWIDRRWMAKYCDLPDMEEMMAKRKPLDFANTSSSLAASAKGSEVVEAFAAEPMRCGGCGAKVGATTVSRVLRAVLERQKKRAIEMGYPLPAPIDHDDAAIQLLPTSDKGGAAVISTIDYFREILLDTYTFGKIVAVHSLSDVHAMGAVPTSALTLAVVPFAADEAITESTLLQLMAGVSDVLQDEQIQLGGGHTCEGLELACGLAVQGYAPDPAKLLRKQGGKIGDVIVLTKPIGTGALFAAEMRARCRGEFVVEAIESMVKSNCHASRVSMESSGVHSCTDVTGFGLVGHLLEMLMANETLDGMDKIGALLKIKNIPFLRGGLQASRNGIYSSLQTQNARNRRAVINHSEAAAKYPSEYPLIFDPQTAGGLMFFVSKEKVDDFVDNLRESGVEGSVIGELTQYPLPSLTSNELDGEVCTIGSGGASTGQRVMIEL